MAGGKKETRNTKFALKLTKPNLTLIQQILIFIGQPFYQILFYLTIGLFFVVYLLKKGLSLLSCLPDYLKLPKIKFTIKFPHLKFKLPKISKKFTIPFTVLFLLIFSLWLIIFRDLPSVDKLSQREIPMSTKIYDRNKVLLYKIYKNTNRTPVSLDEIPLHVRLATLAIEDADFYHHPGFSVRGIIRSIIKNATQGELSGGSTITQQLVKNALLTPEKTLIRKLREIVLSVLVEIKFSKDEILEMYFNEVSYGGTAYGIQEAAQVYFEKNVDELDLAEAALLAGLPKSPTKYSPFGPDPDASFARQKRVLALMEENGYITQEQREKTEKQELKFASNKIGIKAPHFVMYVKNILVEKYGEEMVEQGGLEVITTLDYSIQEFAEKVVKQEIDSLARLHVNNGAVLVINPANGEVLAMVGSKDYFDTTNDGNVNVVLRPRQPGSSIKPINYAYALANGYTPATIIEDTPVKFIIPGQEPYIPRNYDNQFRGKITVRSALAESRNVPAVKILNSYGVDKMIATGKALGITTWTNPEQYGLSLTLGGGEIKLIDLARVYATIANYGQQPQINSIIKVTNQKGKVLEQNDCLTDSGSCQKKVLDPRIAFLLTDILSDNQARSPAFGRNSALVIPGHKEVAVKTGTSNNLRDNLTIGYNQKYLVAVWVGNNDNSPMARIASGVTGASPIWNKIMTSLVAEDRNHSWKVPDGLVRKSCYGKEEWFLEENILPCQPIPAPTSN